MLCLSFRFLFGSFPGSFNFKPPAFEFGFSLFKFFLFPAEFIHRSEGMVRVRRFRTFDRASTWATG